jgi:hypothetical protein
MGCRVKSATSHVIALAQYAMTSSRSWAANSSNQRPIHDPSNYGYDFQSPAESAPFATKIAKDQLVVHEPYH